jgi:hypothetical protein
MSLEESRNSVLLTRGEISAAPRLRESKKFGSREGAKAQSAILRHALIQEFAQPCLVPAMRTPHAQDAPPRLPSARREFSRVAEETTMPTSRTWANLDHLPFAPSRLRANQFFHLRESAVRRRGERSASVIQHFPQSFFPTTTPNQTPNQKKDRKFPAIPCPAGNAHHPRLAMVAA